MAGQAAVCGLVVVVAADGSDGVRERLAASLAAAPVASVILIPPDGQSFQARFLAPLIALAQAGGAAALVADDAALSKAVGADGVHLTASDDIETRAAAARATVGPKAIVGGEVGLSRHLAMCLGEAGADYVGMSGSGAGDDADPGADDAAVEMVGWWAELFEVPGVVFGTRGPEDAGRMAAAGADFVAFDLPRAVPPAEAAALVRQLGDAVADVAISA